MPADHLHLRRPDVVFGLFLASGLTVGAYSLWAVADWIHSQGEDAFGIFYLGALSFIPTLLAALAGGVHMVVAPGYREVRLGVMLIAGHLVWWIVLVGIELWRDDPSFGWVMRMVTTVEPGLYAMGVTWLAFRWFWWGRPRVTGG
jgi:hypothetical protein